jgi:hypothetical protein
LDKFRGKDGNWREQIRRVEGDRLKVWINLEIKMVTGENRSAGGGRYTEGLDKFRGKDGNCREQIGGWKETD